MMDVFTPKKRSIVMSRIRGQDNRSTERRFAAMLSARGIAGWTRRAPDVMGRPDIYFPRFRIALFLDGCFWHACPRCFTMPATNRAFWSRKIDMNIRRDRLVTQRLRRSGVQVFRLWEHEIEESTNHLFQTLDIVMNRERQSKLFTVTARRRQRSL